MLTENCEFDEIYEAYKNLVLKAAYTYSGNYDIAEDIAQNTFLQLYIYYDNMNHSNVKSWLYTTAKNYALNYKKKANREILHEGIAEESFILKTVESAESEFLKGINELDRSELHGRIFAALLEKNPRWYEAISLVYFLEIPQAKVAEEMGIRIEVLHSILHRAKKWIKKTFDEEYDELNQL